MMWEEGVTRGLEAGWYADSSLWPQSLGDQERLGRAGRGVVLQPQPYASGFHRTIPPQSTAPDRWPPGPPSSNDKGRKGAGPCPAWTQE